ncbi:MAG: hypothetical protein JOY62_05195 [Acidobacteriaceae bacterium]|nr:hypothetical protein [Acidobacteriaceae bacterium]MBV9779351.1 hypothetical protein [Acidobacteriaceae bacterium]
MRTLRRNCNLLIGLAVVVSAGSDATADEPKREDKAATAAILLKYVAASQAQADVVRGASMQVEITASVPKLKEEGRLQALRKISKVGQITYHVLGFQGDTTVKSQVIARFLQAEQQGPQAADLSITPANYKFKFKGEWKFGDKDAYLFQLSPRRKVVGLFKGEIWIDAATYLPLYEKGRLVKNPSIFFKKVDFQRAFTIANGTAIPAYMVSTIDTRVVGKVEINIHYSNFEPNAAPDEETGTAVQQ